MATTHFSFKPEQFFNADALKSLFGKTGMDLSDVTSASRRNMETLSAASREAAETAKCLAQCQANYARQVMEDTTSFWRDWMSSGANLQDKAEIQSQAAREGFAKAVAHNKDMTEILQKSQEKLMRSFKEQAAENVSTVKRTARKAADQAEENLRTVKRTVKRTAKKAAGQAARSASTLKKTATKASSQASENARTVGRTAERAANQAAENISTVGRAAERAVEE